MCEDVLVDIGHVDFLFHLYLGDSSQVGAIFISLENSVQGACPYGLSDTILAFGVMHLQYHHFQIHLALLTQISYSFGFGLLLGVI